MGLSAKRRAFVEEYLRGWNATAAAQAAGYVCPNQAGPRLRHEPAVAACINERIAALAMSADEVLLRLGEQARGSMADFVTDDGAIDLARARAAGKLHLVRRYSEAGEKAGASIELYDAQAALEKIGKALGLFRERVEMSGSIDIVNVRAELERRLNRIAAGGEAPDVPGEPEQ